MNILSVALCWLYCLNTFDSIDIIAIATDKTIRLLQRNGQKLDLEIRVERGYHSGYPVLLLYPSYHP